MKDFLKKNWKMILIILLSVMYLSKCASSGNYKRKLNKELEYSEQQKIEAGKGMSQLAKTNDSLRNVIRERDIEIMNLNSTIELLQKQNNQLAKKPVIVKMTENTK